MLPEAMHVRTAHGSMHVGACYDTGKVCIVQTTTEVAQVGLAVGTE